MLKIASARPDCTQFHPVPRVFMSGCDARAGVRTHGKDTGHFEAAFPMLYAQAAPIDDAWEPDSEELSDGSSDDGDAEEDDPFEEPPAEETKPLPQAKSASLPSMWKPSAQSSPHAITELQDQEISDALRLKDSAKLPVLIEKLKKIVAAAESCLSAKSAEGTIARQFCSMPY